MLLYRSLNKHSPYTTQQGLNNTCFCPGNLSGDGFTNLLGPYCSLPEFVLETAWCPDTPYCSPCTERYSYFNNESKEGHNIFPNPASDYFRIDNVEVGSVITLRNIIGECVLTKIIGPNNFDVSITELPSGLYILSVNGIKRTKLIKIQ